jgi:hypothetical protein
VLSARDHLGSQPVCCEPMSSPAPFSALDHRFHGATAERVGGTRMEDDNDVTLDCLGVGASHQVHSVE